MTRPVHLSADECRRRRVRAYRLLVRWANESKQAHTGAGRQAQTPVAPGASPANGPETELEYSTCGERVQVHPSR